MADPLDASAERHALLTHVARLHVEGTLRPCCQRPENLTREHTIPQRPDLVVRLCRHCHRRHFRLTAEPGRLGAVLG